MQAKYHTPHGIRWTNPLLNEKEISPDLITTDGAYISVLDGQTTVILVSDSNIRYGHIKYDSMYLTYQWLNYYIFMLLIFYTYWHVDTSLFILMPGFIRYIKEI